jgi:hypothetical protein
VPWSQIRSVTFSDDRQQAMITGEDGEKLEGRIVSASVRLKTVLGEFSIPWTKITELQVDPYRQVPDCLTHRPRPPRPVQFEITLRDGSWLLATPDSGQTKLYSDLLEFDLPWARVRKVVFDDSEQACRFEFWNGDVVKGHVQWKTVRLSSGLGPVYVVPKHTESVKLSLGGIDLVNKPYASATGNRHFLHALKNTQPMRVRGRVVPASQLICAHASGQIEYVFDQPVREFHGILTMWQSYCAKKGNVIFKLQTDEGLVYASRPIRNFDEEEVYVRFRPTRRLLLITDQNGSVDEDWSVWLRPEVR